MMAFRAIVFPEKISFHARGGAEFSTDRIIFGSGDEARNRNWAKHRGRWDVSHAARLPEVWKPLQAFFNAVGGSADGFLFKDWFDYQAASGEGVLITIDGTHKQLARRWTFGSVTYDHPIYKPKTGKVTLIGGGTLDYTTGIVTGGGTAWTGEYYKPARFDVDRMEGEIINKNNTDGFIVGWDPIPIIETRLEP
jgi:uncharacterized protein (TIGR02217 family)